MRRESAPHSQQRVLRHQAGPSRCVVSSESLNVLCPLCPAHGGTACAGALCREKGSIKTIVKKTYGRGAGSLMHCAAGLEEDAGLCYPPCPDSSYSGVGPLCWEGCPTANPINGGALCCTTQGVCTKKIIALSTDMPRTIAEAIINAEDPFSVISVLACLHVVHLVVLSRITLRCCYRCPRLPVWDCVVCKSVASHCAVVFWSISGRKEHDRRHSWVRHALVRQGVTTVTSRHVRFAPGPGPGPSRYY